MRLPVLVRFASSQLPRPEDGQLPREGAELGGQGAGIGAIAAVVHCCLLQERRLLRRKRQHLLRAPQLQCSSLPIHRGVLVCWRRCATNHQT